MAEIEINVPELKCTKKGCGHTWIPRPKKENIVIVEGKQFLKVDRCPNCKQCKYITMVKKDAKV